ncbi:MAG: metallophosphoesterase [Sandaracinaceae bacterium]
MRIVNLATKPFDRLRYLNAGRRGKTVSSTLEIVKGEVLGLPKALDALIATSDLQGVVPSWRRDGANVLLGEHLPDHLVGLAEEGALPYPERTGVVLAGDLFSAPAANVRGASGDVRGVWNAFAEQYRWVVGVAGNHDRFGTDRERARLQSRVHLLDDDVVQLDGVLFGGVGEVMGDPAKPGRRAESDLLAGVDLVVEQNPDVVVLHQGPPGNRQQRGSDLVKAALQPTGALVVCGHVHWDEALFSVDGGPQVLNVDARVVVLTRAS